MHDMSHEDINLGTATHEPKEETVTSPDMGRYYYPPGKTEPELKPEFVNAGVPPTITTAQPVAESVPEPEPPKPAEKTETMIEASPDEEAEE